MNFPAYTPPFHLNNGIAMTSYIALRARHNWQRTVRYDAPPEREEHFIGAGNTPIYGRVAIPKHPKGTFIATYGIVGSLDDQWYLHLLTRKAYHRGYAVVTFDWRAHGRTGQLSPTLSSDGLYEGEDYLRIAARALELGCPAPIWFSGYSLSGQLALWGVRIAETEPHRIADLDNDRDVLDALAGAAVICPSVDSTRSLRYLMSHPVGRYMEKAIVRQLKKLLHDLHREHPHAIARDAIRRADSIWGFDREFVIPRLGFDSVEAYYAASSPLPWLGQLQHPTLILYAADDPLFAPDVLGDLKPICYANSAIDFVLTERGGHVGYLASKHCQQQSGDDDRWWAWNRILAWCSEISRDRAVI
ncbi:MAG: alpha/beta fold hydrolase [Cyanobacteria bacterium SID2]|nr:alpha/beta fold hydrolase [Cyanobacteria bacterium SID2]MBP0004309.1 alpha/beta fold hydrolase [Cyanobacteria bacterium SBC]